MEQIISLMVLCALWLLIAPLVALVKAANANRNAKEIRRELLNLYERLAKLERAQMTSRPEVEPTPAAEPSADLHDPQHEADDEEYKPAQVHEWLREQERQLDISNSTQTTPPPVPPPLAAADDAAFLLETTPPPAPQEPFSLEKFMGVKLFAWLGGVAMFFGVIFFVKYAFENNLVPPEVRIAMGFVTGAGLLAGGLLTHRQPRYRVLAQALCATGVLILYGVTFAARAIYKFDAFGTGPSFVLMALITVAAFLVAVRLDALVVAVLGMLGGFMTPVLVNTGHDNVLGLFGYIALLDIGLLAVSRHGRWSFLKTAGSIGTALMQLGWFAKFFVSGRYFEGSQTLIPMGIMVFFIVLFLAGGWLQNRRQGVDGFGAGAVLGLAAVAMAFAFVMLGFEQVAGRYWQLYGFVLLVQSAVIAVVAARPQWGLAQLAAAGFAFLHLALWSQRYLAPDNLHAALTLYLIFGALHAVVPVVLARRPAMPAAVPLQVSPWFATLVLLLLLLPLFHLSPVPLAIWAAILLADLLVIGLAVVTGAVVPVLASLVLTMGVAALWLLRVPAHVSHLSPFLGVITGFSALFALAGGKLFRVLPTDKDRLSPQDMAASLLPVAAGVLPFALLILALMHLPVANPSPVFGVALLMIILLSGLALLGKQGPLVMAALLATLAVEAVWHTQHFQAAAPLVALWWYLGFYMLFLVLPFVFRKTCADQPAPWIASALSGVGHFLLVHDLVKQAWPNNMMGLIPAAFAVPAFIALVAVIRAGPTMTSANRSRLAWFGGVALLFVTLIFPIQFDRQWLTVSWALEGALLLWLFRRVAHPGLQLTGLALLTVSFVRLTFNPAVFTDYPRGAIAVFNWHLYTYGVVAAAQILGARWFSDPASRWTRVQPRGLLMAFGGVLLFLLLNIEIADYFTPPGERCIAFRFGGNFARDMTYSIGWGLFSLGLLGIGIWKKSKHARFAAIGLLVVTLLKVFLHDLSAIENIFRIGALVSVAIIAFITSFLYQRFFDRPNPS